MKKLLSLIITFTLMIAGLNLSTAIAKNAEASPSNNNLVCVNPASSTAQAQSTTTSSSSSSTVPAPINTPKPCNTNNSSSASSSNTSSSSLSGPLVCKTPLYVTPAIPATLVSGRCFIVVCSQGLIAAAPAHCPTGSNPQLFADCNFGPYQNDVKVACDEHQPEIANQTSSSSVAALNSMSSASSSSISVALVPTGGQGGGTITVGNSVTLSSTTSSKLSGVKGFVASESEKAIVKTTPPTYITVTKVSLKGYTVRTGGSN